MIRDLYSRCKEKGFDIVDEMEDCLLLNGERAYGLRENLFKAVKGYRTQEGNTLYPHIYIPAFENRVDYLERMESDEIIVVTDRVVPDGKKFYGKKIDDDLQVNPTDFAVEENDANEKEIWVIAFNERVDDSAKCVPNLINLEEVKAINAVQALDANNLFLEKIYCSNLSAIEAWTRGGPELEVKIFQKDAKEFWKGLYKMKREAINRAWYVVNTYVGYWRYQEYGDRLMCYWREIDGGDDNQSVNLNWQPFKGGPSINVSLNIGSKDDDIGYQLIDRENFPAPYSVGILDWRMHY